jgi:hypothetical protein
MKTCDITRRNFIVGATMGAVVAGTTVFLYRKGLKHEQTGPGETNPKAVSPKPSGTPMQIADTKDVFRKCGACSHTFCFLLNREFGHPDSDAQNASNPLAGGLMMGHQCGMLWGSSLAIGAEAFRRYPNRDEATAKAILATQSVMASFTSRTGSIDCHDITGADFTKITGMAKYMLKIIFHGGIKNSPCFNLSDKWAPEAIASAKEALAGQPANTPTGCRSCASEMIAKMGGNDEDVVTAAGLAGGMGLSGHACGALGAAVWMNTKRWCELHPGETPDLFKPKKSKLLQAFYKVTNNEILCSTIAGTTFKSINDHTGFIESGGCNRLIDTLSAIKEA